MAPYRGYQLRDNCSPEEGGKEREGLKKEELPASFMEVRRGREGGEVETVLLSFFLQVSSILHWMVQTDREKEGGRRKRRKIKKRINHQIKSQPREGRRRRANWLV